MNGNEEDVFPADDDLFEDTFSADCVYKFCGEEFKINQAFSANLGVAAPVWDAVSIQICHDQCNSFEFCFDNSRHQKCFLLQALHLCRFFEEKCINLKGKKIIELGAGTGIVGILAARLGKSFQKKIALPERYYHVYPVGVRTLPFQSRSFSDTAV